MYSIHTCVRTYVHTYVCTYVLMLCISPPCFCVHLTQCTYVHTLIFTHVAPILPSPVVGPSWWFCCQEECFWQIGTFIMYVYAYLFVRMSCRKSYIYWGHT